MGQGFGHLRIAPVVSAQPRTSRDGKSEDPPHPTKSGLQVCACNQILLIRGGAQAPDAGGMPMLRGPLEESPSAATRFQTHATR
jgi:hypothetical protein